MPTPQEMILEQKIIQAKQCPGMSWNDIERIISQASSRYMNMPIVKIAIQQDDDTNLYGCNFVKDVIVTHEEDEKLLTNVILVTLVLGMDEEKRKLILQ